jgi:alpha-tubulin suppressor-like RCC1 family protein
MPARTTMHSLVPILVLGFAHPAAATGQDSLRFTAVSAGSRHTCALTASERAYCWGDNGEGELGDSTRIDSPAPVAVAGDLTFLMIDAGVEITCGVTTTGRAYCWGRNSTGALGNAAMPRSTVPVPVIGGLLFRSVAVGADHACGLTADRSAYCWGANLEGQLGTKDTASSPRPLPVSGGLRFRMLTAGDEHTCGITVDSLAYCWGSNQRGQLGIGSRRTPLGPQAVAFGRRWKVLSAGSRYTCGVTAERHGAMYCWGDNFHEQINPRNSFATLGDPILWSPTFAGEPLNLLDVSAGRWHTCVVRDRDVNPVSCRGANLDNQLGRNVLGEYIQVSAGDAHTCALRRDGAIYCWGRNAAGQLGDGTLYNEQFPVRVVDPVAARP